MNINKLNEIPLEWLLEEEIRDLIIENKFFDESSEFRLFKRFRGNKI